MKIFRKLAYYAYSIFEIVWNIKNWIMLTPLLLGKKTEGEHTVRLRQPPVRLLVRSGMDVWAVKETFLDAFYTQYGVNIQNGWTVMDIGAAFGDFSIFAAYGNPQTVIYAFEPFPDSYALLIKNLAMNAIDNVIAFQEAVWCRCGGLALDVSEGEPLKVVSKDADAVMEKDDTVIIEALTLKHFLDRQGLEKVDLLKLDCEGAEYEILIEAPSALSKIDRIIMEYHDLDAEKNHQRLISFLEGEGYTVVHYPNIVHDAIGYLYAERP